MCLKCKAHLKVQEIALLVGYKDVAHFSNTFKHIQGLSPLLIDSASRWAIAEKQSEAPRQIAAGLVCGYWIYV